MSSKGDHDTVIEYFTRYSEVDGEQQKIVLGVYDSFETYTRYYGKTWEIWLASCGKLQGQNLKFTLDKSLVDGEEQIQKRS